MAEIEIKVPDIGSDEAVEVIEVLAQVGDAIEEEGSLITLESDKATLEVPSSDSGRLVELKVKVGDKVKEGDIIAVLETEAAAAENSSRAEEKAEVVVSAAASHAEIEVLVPDVGSDEAVEVIEVLVQAGDTIAAEDSIITLESDKATLEVPSSHAGVITAMKVKVGDKVKTGDVILMLQTTARPAAKTTQTKEPAKTITETTKAAPVKQQMVSTGSASVADIEASLSDPSVYAGPAVRRLARELGVDLRRVTGSGHKGRLISADLKAYVKQTMTQAQTGQLSQGSGLPQAPAVDFAEFGEIDSQPLTKINKLTAEHMRRCWLLVPHVTQHDHADITDLEAFRKQQKALAEKHGFKLTPLAFIMKAAAYALQQFPRCNSSLDTSGDALIIKKYINIGVAVDTPNGLVVPVIRDVDKKGAFDLAKELGEVSKRAREGKLTPKDMKGGTFTISSLGGIGGTAFTPIVNMPEVAILGVARSEIKPVYNGKEFEPRLMLPLSLSYDHRVIDGAEGARFTRTIANLLTDLRQLVL